MQDAFKAYGVNITPFQCLRNNKNVSYVVLNSSMRGEVASLWLVPHRLMYMYMCCITVIV